MRTCKIYIRFEFNGNIPYIFSIIDSFRVATDFKVPKTTSLEQARSYLNSCTRYLLGSD